MDGLSQNQNQPEEPKKNALLQEFEFGVGGVMLGIGTFLLMLFVLNYFNIVSLSLVFPNQLGFLPHRQYSQQKPPTPVFNFTQREAPTGASPTPTPPLVATLETCEVTKEGNPLVDSLRQVNVGTGSAQQSITVGTFRGNINKLTYDAGKQIAALELIAPKGDQQHTFNLKEEPGLVHDAIALQDLTLTDLKVGQTVVISFNCDTAAEKFRITQVAITGK